MAYLNLLASISENCIVDFQNNKSTLFASRITHVSHILAYWIKVQPLGKVLSEAIDGGEKNFPNIGHPFRIPVWHKANSVKVILNELESAWKTAIDENGKPAEDDWYKIEIEKVIDIFKYASKQNEAIISFLDINNFDIEKNRKIKIPIELKYEI